MSVPCGVRRKVELPAGADVVSGAEHGPVVHDTPLVEVGDLLPSVLLAERSPGDLHQGVQPHHGDRGPARVAGIPWGLGRRLASIGVANAVLPVSGTVSVALGVVGEASRGGSAGGDLQCVVGGRGRGTTEGDRGRDSGHDDRGDQPPRKLLLHSEGERGTQLDPVGAERGDRLDEHADHQLGPQHPYRGREQPDDRTVGERRRQRDPFGRPRVADKGDQRPGRNDKQRQQHERRGRGSEPSHRFIPFLKQTSHRGWSPSAADVSHRARRPVEA